MAPTIKAEQSSVSCDDAKNAPHPTWANRPNDDGDFLADEKTRKPKGKKIKKMRTTYDK